jgi:hypothetical protein
LPEFKPLYIDNWDNYGLLNLPPNVNTYDPFELFSLFFIDEIMDKLVEWMNEYTELYLLNKELEYLRIWQPICKQELYTYFIV